jgi:hypothetical protein
MTPHYFSLLYTNSKHGSIQTAANYVTFPNQNIASIIISNSTDKVLFLKQNDIDFHILPESYFHVLGVTNTNELSLKMSDNTVQTITYRLLFNY